ncbi:hypothetical protein M9H77_22854 [Catharanthus roseus]|uniref:Uncharacterized protein n=1 Tax=Catharanthus roseus TaxID=4058 RepID=A0ACC0ASC8_CATRO|nr:hypothetical protein M9H77_22854 [Catharanthus roseus]
MVMISLLWISDTLGNVGSIPIESSKVSTADDMEIANYNELVDLKMLNDWKKNRKMSYEYRESGSMFYYKGLGVPRGLDLFTPLGVTAMFSNLCSRIAASLASMASFVSLSYFPKLETNKRISNQHRFQK